MVRGRLGVVAGEVTAMGELQSLRLAAVCVVSLPTAATQPWKSCVGQSFSFALCAEDWLSFENMREIVGERREGKSLQS